MSPSTIEVREELGNRCAHAHSQQRAGVPEEVLQRILVKQPLPAPTPLVAQLDDAQGSLATALYDRGKAARHKMP